MHRSPHSAFPLCLTRGLRLVAALSLGLAVAPRVLAAQASAPPEVTAAQQALAAGRADSAIVILEAFFVRNPEVSTGKLVLAAAYRQRGESDRALRTLLGITQPRPLRLQARFNAAAIYAARGQADSSLRLLRDVKESGAFDVEQARFAPEFEMVRRDARFDSVMFHPRDFVSPFVEPVRIIHEFVGETKGDQFSWIARRLGDVDGDGVSDFVTSAPSFGVTARAAAAPANTPPPARGRVYVYSGRAGRLLWQQTGEVGDNLGTGLESAGDVDGDGVPDVIAGAPGGHRAYVYSGRDGHVVHVLRSASASEGFGSSASGVGDVNGDGRADLMVGAPSHSSVLPGAGRVYLFSGRDGSTLFTLDGQTAGESFGSIVAGAKAGSGAPLLVGAPGAGPRLRDQPPRGRVYAFDASTRRLRFVIDADSTGVALGAMFTSLVGDIDRDRVPDVYASDFSDAAKGAATGAVYVHSGATGARLLRLAGEQAGDGFGIGSADVGDVDRDGFDDLIVGAWQYSRVAPSGGRVYLYSGRSGALIRTLTGRIPGETLGFDATGIGDVDGDGLIDLLVTSSWSNVRGFRSGRMYIIAGTSAR
jgi:FG-GAP repeat